MKSLTETFKPSPVVQTYAQPTSTPPGGGRWDWDGYNQIWIPADSLVSETNLTEE